MGAITSQITSLTIVYSTVYSDADQRKHQSSASLAFVRGIHRGPVNSPHKWPVTRKMFPFGDVIMDRCHDDIIKWKHFLRHWPFVLGIHWSPVNSPHKGQWCRALMFSLIWAWTNCWINNQDGGDLRCHHAHYDLTVMVLAKEGRCCFSNLLRFCSAIERKQDHWFTDAYFIRIFLISKVYIFIRHSLFD